MCPAVPTVSGMSAPGALLFPRLASLLVTSADLCDRLGFVCAVAEDQIRLILKSDRRPGSLTQNVPGSLRRCDLTQCLLLREKPALKDDTVNGLMDVLPVLNVVHNRKVVADHSCATLTPVVLSERREPDHLAFVRDRRDEVHELSIGLRAQRHACTAAAASSASSSVRVRQSRRRRPSRTTPTTGGSPVRSGSASDSSRAHAKLRSSASGSAPPPTRPTVSSTSPPVAAASRSARARIVAASWARVRNTGIRSGASRWRRSVPSSAASESLSIRSARWSGWRRNFSTRSARPRTMPACGPPRSLSPEKQTRSAPPASASFAVGSKSLSDKLSLSEMR